MANLGQLYIGISIAALAVVAVLLIVANRKKKQKRLSPLVGLSFGLIIAGIIFGDDRLIGYCLIAAGVVLAVADAIAKLRKM
jgi:uncharacterized membrane protein